MSTVEPETKKQKVDNGSGDSHDASLDSAHLFKDFEVEKTLLENAQKKMIIVQGRYKEKESPALVIMEKCGFTESGVGEMLSPDSEISTNLDNDIYSSHTLYPPPKTNGVKVTRIFPATQKHIDKYSSHPAFMVQESTKDYKELTLPFINKELFSFQWVYNILDKKTESERIVYEDPDKENGFILLPDMKWDGKQKEDLYLIAIIHRRNIKSLRDLTTEHLPLLKNILEKGQAAISERYGLPACQQRVYLHYQPSYYHLHVHFTALRFDAPGSSVERGHLLTDVIENIDFDPEYYQKKTLSFVIRENQGLYQVYKDQGRI